MTHKKLKFSVVDVEKPSFNFVKKHSRTWIQVKQACWLWQAQLTRHEVYATMSYGSEKVSGIIPAVEVPETKEARYTSNFR